MFSVLCQQEERGKNIPAYLGNQRMFFFFFQEAINVISAQQLIVSFDNTLSSLCACGVLFIYCTSIENGFSFLSFFCQRDGKHGERRVMEKEMECT